jgi:transposase
MLTVVWNPFGFHLVTVLPKGQKWTGQYYIENVLCKICEILQPEGPRRLVIHADNARPHVAKIVKGFLDAHGLRAAPHPPYSPDLAPSDFFLFGHVKRALQGSVFETVDELLKGVTEILSAIQPETLVGVFQEWMERIQTCIDCDGEYVE